MDFGELHTGDDGSQPRVPIRLPFLTFASSAENRKGFLTPGRIIGHRDYSHKNNSMRTLTKIFFVAALTTVTVSYAGPNPQFWNRPFAKPIPEKSKTAEMTATTTNSSLVCAKMWIPNNAFKQAPYHVVNCTPEMMAKNEWRCQLACTQATKKC